jgi:hypothetical protein
LRRQQRGKERHVEKFIVYNGEGNRRLAEALLAMEADRKAIVVV